MLTVPQTVLWRMLSTCGRLAHSCSIMWTLYSNLLGVLADDTGGINNVSIDDSGVSVKSSLVAPQVSDNMMLVISLTGVRTEGILSSGHSGTAG